MTHKQLRAPRATPAVVAAALAALLLAGCAGAPRPTTNLAGQPTATAGAIDNPATTPPGATAPATSPPATSPATHPTSTPTSAPGTGHGAVTVSAITSAVVSSYTGLCAPPTTATTFRAVISVRSGPVTVTYRWTTSNGGDSDPSTHTVHFSGTGPQSTTVTHHEHSYPPLPYPAQITDWVAVDLLTPVQAQSNRVSMSIHCIPFTVAIKRTTDDYTGHCPPAADTSGFDLYVVADETVDATVHWELSNGGDSGPNPTSTMHLVPGQNILHHMEQLYPPAPYPATHNDWVAAVVSIPGFTVDTDKVVFAVNCTS